MDEDGKGTTDPSAALKGALLPFGGHKGYGIGILVDLLTGALAGSSLGLGVQQNNPDPDVGGQSFFFLAINPEFFSSKEVFAEQVDKLTRDTKSAKTAKGSLRCCCRASWSGARSRSASRTASLSTMETGRRCWRTWKGAGLPKELVEQYAPDA